MRTLILVAAALGLAACDGAARDADGPGAPVAAGRANTSYQPAFVGQTRAPEMRSELRLRIDIVARDLVEPWALEFLPDGRTLVTERPGRLRVVSRDGAMSEPIAGMPDVDARNQGGLLDIALSPTFATDRLIYWSYSEPRGRRRNGTTAARGRLSDDDSRVDNVEIIFRQEPAWDSTLHFGSRLVWARDGALFITLGERSHRESRVLAQDLGAHLGKVVRVRPDGSVPPDNPFVGRAGALPEIWSYGHRNIQGATLHPDSGELWTIEHGPRGGDELNTPRAGRNYGWPIITYGIEYSGGAIGEGVTQREGMEQPLYYWDPVIAPGGMTFYRGDLFPWRGDLLISALKPAALVRLELDGTRVIGEERLLTNVGRVRDVVEAPDGAVWIVTDEERGRVLRVTPLS